MFTVRSTLMWAVLTGPTDWVCHIGTLTLCVEAVAWSCINVTWWSGSGVIQAWSRRPTGFLQCFDTVGLVIWPVKIVPEMTYNVLSGTFSLYTTTTGFVNYKSVVLVHQYFVCVFNLPVVQRLCESCHCVMISLMGDAARCIDRCYSHSSTRALSRLSDRGRMVAMSGRSRPNQFCKCAIVGLRTTFYTLWCAILMCQFLTRGS